MHWPQALAYEGGMYRYNNPRASYINGADQIKMPRNEDGSIKLDANPPSIGDVWAKFEDLLGSGKAKAIGSYLFRISVFTY